jgi:hypothetical protein
MRFTMKGKGIWIRIAIYLAVILLLYFAIRS